MNEFPRSQLPPRRPSLEPIGDPQVKVRPLQNIPNRCRVAPDQTMWPDAGWRHAETEVAVTGPGQPRGLIGCNATLTPHPATAPLTPSHFNSHFLPIYRVEMFVLPVPSGTGVFLPAFPPSCFHSARPLIEKACRSGLWSLGAQVMYAFGRSPIVSPSIRSSPTAPLAHGYPPVSVAHPRPPSV